MDPIPRGVRDSDSVCYDDAYQLVPVSIQNDIKLDVILYYFSSFVFFYQAQFIVRDVKRKRCLHVG